MSSLPPEALPRALLEYSVVYTDRALNHMSPVFQGVMRDVSAILKVAYAAHSAVVVPGALVDAGSDGYMPSAVCVLTGPLNGVVFMDKNGNRTGTMTQKFKLDGATLEHFEVDDITRSTIPEDFARNPRIHVCYVLRPQVAASARQ